MYDILALSEKLLPELRQIAKEMKIKRVESFKKQELIYKILDVQAESPMADFFVSFSLNTIYCGNHFFVLEHYNYTIFVISSKKKIAI